MLYKGCKNMYDFTQFKMIQSFGDAIKWRCNNDITTMDMKNDEQQQVAKKIRESQ